MVDAEGNRYDDVNFYSAVSSSTSRVLRTSPYEFTVTNVKNTSGDTYQFITLDNRVTSLKITTEAVTVDSFSIKCSPTEATLPLNGGKASTVVTGTINGNPAQVYCLETGETKASGSTWQFAEAGFYNFCLVANGTIRTSFRVKAASYHYKVEVVEANSGQYVTNLTKITGSLNNTRFITSEKTLINADLCRQGGNRHISLFTQYTDLLINCHRTASFTDILPNKGICRLNTIVKQAII